MKIIMHKVNFKFKFLIMTVFIFTIFNSCRNTNFPHPVKGILDLTNWDFIADGAVKLNGEWEFYWRQLLTYEDFKNNNMNFSDFFELPNTWNHHKLNDKKLNTFGYATYRLVILKDKNENNNLALKIPKMSTAYNLFINDKKIASNGIVGMSKQKMRPQYLPIAVDFHTDSDKFEIIIQVSNFYERLNGLRESLILGEKKQILKLREFNLAFDILLFGCVLLMSLYHLNLFILRRKDFVPLYFGLFCLIIAIRISVSSELFLCQLFPDINWEVIRKTFALTFFLAVPLFAMFIHSLYEKEFSRKILLIIQVTGIFFSLLTIFTPAVIYTYGIGIFNYFTFFCCIYVVCVLFASLLNKREGAIIFVIASVIFFITVINDILYMETYIKSMMLVPFGLLIFIFFQVFMLGRRFSLSFAKVESMSNELQYVNKEINELNVNLEKKVHERTIELEQAKNLIERASQEKSLFFTNIAHEIKTPLTLIHNYLNSYIEKAGLNNDLKVIRQNFQKMLNDMLNFLDAEKLDKGNIFYNHDQIINLSDIIKEKIELLKTNASKKYILLTDDIESDLYIKSEPQAIERIINNLADNSIKYTNNGGKIHIKLIGKNNKVFLSVKDTGIGISEEMQEKIFKPYYQLSNNKQNVQGIGMGLFIVKKTVESLNGKILLESEPIKGSTFTVVLDKYNAETDEIISNDLNNTDNTLTSRRINIDNYDNFIVKPNILIIEDNSDMADFLSDYFSNTYNVYSGKNGKDALAKLKVIPMPEIIITDIMMNEIDGFEFIEYLYSNDKYKNIPVVFLTAKTTLKSKIEGLKKGAVDYIYKPFEIEELSMKINSIINNRRHQKVQDKEKIKKYLIKSLADFENETESENNKNNESNNYEIHKEKIMNNKNISDREKEVINLLVKGLQHKEIASQLNISVKTVENHISKIYKKFNVENKVELMNSLINNLNF